MISEELIRKIEELALFPHSKGLIIVTKLGLKPASEVGTNAYLMHEHNLHPDVKKDSNGVWKVPVDAIRKLDIVMNELEVPHYPVHCSILEKGYGGKIPTETYGVTFAHAQEGLDKLSRASITGSDYEIGLAFGYPKSCVEADTGRRKIDPKQPQVKLSDYQRRTLNFVPYIIEFRDPECVEDALKDAELYASVIKKLSPLLYDQIMSSGRQF